jgi:glucan biosynthesis protein
MIDVSARIFFNTSYNTLNRGISSTYSKKPMIRFYKNAGRISFNKEAALVLNLSDGQKISFFRNKITFDDKLGIDLVERKGLYIFYHSKYCNDVFTYFKDLHHIKDDIKAVSFYLEKGNLSNVIYTFDKYKL